jgi:uncharacterized protein
MAILTRRRFLLGSAGCLGLLAPAAWYSAVYEPSDLQVVSHDVSIRGLPGRLDGLRAAQISDLHITTVGDVQTKAIEAIQNLKPDVLFVTGDFVDDATAIGATLELLSLASPPLGIWSVPGNWDHTSDAIGGLQSGFGSVKGKFLINDSAELEQGLWIVGVDDPASGYDNLDGAIAGVPAQGPRILLAHSPDIVPALSGQRFDLVLSGHTHGGQVNLPFINGTWLKDGPPRQYVRGFYTAHGSPLYVNRGIGTTHLPIRIDASPEVTLFTFHGA